MSTEKIHEKIKPYVTKNLAYDFLIDEFKLKAMSGLRGFNLKSIDSNYKTALMYANRILNQ